MDHRQLQFLVALARERHFGRAAARCNVTQPTLSARLKQLEDELGIALIERGRRFERFTAEGERVLQHARSILDEFDELKGDAKGRNCHHRLLRIGTVPAALADVVNWPQLMIPSVAFRIREYAMPALLQALAEHEIDLAVGYLDPVLALSDDFHVLPLFHERMMVFASPKHYKLPMQVDWDALEQYPHGVLTPEMRQRRRVEHLFGQLNLDIDIRFEADSAMALIMMVAQGHGITVLPQSFKDIANGMDIVVRDLPDANIESARVGVIWRGSEKPSGSLSQLIDSFSSTRLIDRID